MLCCALGHVVWGSAPWPVFCVCQRQCDVPLWHLALCALRFPREFVRWWRKAVARPKCSVCAFQLYIHVLFGCDLLFTGGIIHSINGPSRTCGDSEPMAPFAQSSEFRFSFFRFQTKYAGQTYNLSFVLYF